MNNSTAGKLWLLESWLRTLAVAALSALRVS